MNSATRYLTRILLKPDGFVPLRRPNRLALQFHSEQQPWNFQHQQFRLRHSARLNTVVVFVPQQEAWIIERMGRFNRILDPGLNVLLPVLDSISYVQSLKEIAIDIPQQSAVTSDNVTLHIDGVLYLKVNDPYKASYGVEDPEFAITQLAQTTMRSEIGKINLDSVFREREMLNIAIVESINLASNSWGLTCMRYEIRDITLPARVQEAMQMQVEAERKKRAAVLESEGIREAEINVAEGKKKSRILSSEAHLMEQVNEAKGLAEATRLKAEAKSKAIHIVGQSLRSIEGSDAASLNIAEQYIGAFSKLAKTGNTLILSSDAGDIAKMSANALQVYKTLSRPDRIDEELDEEDPEEYYSNQEDGNNK
ncbi:Stomatin-like protein 2, mitochondrial [Dermatophagoides farinae]|uniref:Stomatin-like protein 2, mitochondrial n=1 Tax=Dermatophagoides farinae TaxID=6954 RepID=A0A922KW69_DERFA|nr:Stomatin-like protein 2, mitochondrial [Dermatophagoides farinae]